MILFSNARKLTFALLLFRKKKKKKKKKKVSYSPQKIFVFFSLIKILYAYHNILSHFCQKIFFLNGLTRNGK